MKLQKLGGYASIALVLVSIAGIGLLLIAFRGFTGSDSSLDPAKMIAAYETSPFVFKTYYILQILTGILILAVTLALQERMQAKAPNLMRSAVIATSIGSALALTAMMSGFLRYGLIAATGDMSAYRSALVMYTCISGAADNAWGWAFLMIGLAAVMTRALSRILGCIIVVLGVAMICQFAIELLGAASIVLFFISMVWIGVVLLRKPQPSPA